PHLFASPRAPPPVIRRPCIQATSFPWVRQCSPILEGLHEALHTTGRLGPIPVRRPCGAGAGGRPVLSIPEKLLFLILAGISVFFAYRGLAPLWRAVARGQRAPVTPPT